MSCVRTRNTGRTIDGKPSRTTDGHEPDENDNTRKEGESTGNERGSRARGRGGRANKRVRHPFPPSRSSFVAAFLHQRAKQCAQTMCLALSRLPVGQVRRQYGFAADRMSKFTDCQIALMCEKAGRRRYGPAAPPSANPSLSLSMARAIDTKRPTHGNGGRFGGGEHSYPASLSTIGYLAKTRAGQNTCRPRCGHTRGAKPA